MYSVEFANMVARKYYLHEDVSISLNFRKLVSPLVSNDASSIFKGNMSSFRTSERGTNTSFNIPGYL